MPEACCHCRKNVFPLLTHVHESTGHIDCDTQDPSSSVAAVEHSKLTEEWKHELESGGGSIHKTKEEALLEQESYEEWLNSKSAYHMFGPPSPPSRGIFKRYVTSWQQVD